MLYLSPLNLVLTLLLKSASIRGDLKGGPQAVFAGGARREIEIEIALRPL
jgi:hypothetical protein